jgi:RNA-directed DNA polymerase
MINEPITVQNLRRKIYIKAKAEPEWRFWGLYVHVCKLEVLQESYRLARLNNGAPGIDNVSFYQIEEYGVDKYLREIQSELVSKSYYPLRNRLKEIPKANGTRTLGIPAIRDRIVQGALKLILEPIFEADFQDGSFGYRPKRTAQAAVDRVAVAIVKEHTKVIDIDLKAYFNNVRHHILLEKIAKRVQDTDILHLVKLILKANGKKGVPQGGLISPLFSNIYLNEVDKMLEKAKKVTSQGQYTHIEYSRFADDLVVLIDMHPKWRWLLNAAYQRIREELAKLEVELNQDKTKILDLRDGSSFNFLGFTLKRNKTVSGKWGAHRSPKLEARTKLLAKLRTIFKAYRSQPIRWVVTEINPILRGWVNYFRAGNSARCFGYIKEWVEKKIRRHCMKAKKLKGFGWNRWSTDWIYKELEVYNNYKVRYN